MNALAKDLSLVSVLISDPKTYFVPSPGTPLVTPKGKVGLLDAMAEVSEIVSIGNPRYRALRLAISDQIPDSFGTEQNKIIGFLAEASHAEVLQVINNAINEASK